MSQKALMRWSYAFLVIQLSVSMLRVTNHAWVGWICCFMILFLNTINLIAVRRAARESKEIYKRLIAELDDYVD